MKAIVFIILVMLDLSKTIPTDTISTTIGKAFYQNKFVKYETQHDIVHILASINFTQPNISVSSSELMNPLATTIYFVEANLTTEGKRVNQSAYMYKDGNVTMLLRHGRDIAATENNPLIFFGTKEGIYVLKNDVVKKYGLISDSIISIDVDKSADALYILTEDQETFRVTNNGSKKEKININKAQQLAVPCKDTLYYSSNNQMYIHTSNGTKKVDGLPEKPTHITILKSSIKREDFVLCIVDNICYYVYSDATSQHVGVKFEQDALPSSFDVSANLIQFYGYNKKLYVYNYLDIYAQQVFEDLRNTIITDFDIK